jgi:hypothetical protein
LREREPEALLDLQPAALNALCAITAALMMLTCGCAKLSGYWPQRWNAIPLRETNRQTQPMPQTRELPAAHHREALRHHHRIAHHETRSVTGAVDVQQTLQPAQSLPQPAPTVTLAGEDPSLAPTQHSLDVAASELAHVDRAKLNTNDASAYDEVGGFIRAGREALARHDYLAAAGFAQKASALASRLPENGP